MNLPPLLINFFSFLNISSLKLREIVVDEQGLCSKSSFYRILTEIEESDHVDVVRQGNEKLYLSKLIKRV